MFRDSFSQSHPTMAVDGVSLFCGVLLLLLISAAIFSTLIYFCLMEFYDRYSQSRVRSTYDPGF